MAALIFWSSVAAVVWTYLGYPLGMVLRARLRAGGRWPALDPLPPPPPRFEASTAAPAPRAAGEPEPGPGPEPAAAPPRARAAPAPDPDPDPVPYRGARAAAGPTPPDAPLVSVVLAVRNGARWLEGRLANLLAQRYPSDRLEVLVVCNGCTDGSGAIAAAWAAGDPRVRALESPADGGKAGALNQGVAEARGDVVVFADVRQRFDPDAVRLLAEVLARPGVGAVTGRLVIEDARRPVAAGFGRYWQLETLLRLAESETGSVVGATGAIYAVRRASYVPIPPGALLDDVYLPLRVAMGGERVVMEPRALAWDEATEDPVREYRRRVRTLTGNLQLLGLAPELLRPGHPLFVRFMSHKILRVLSPLFFLAVVGSGLWVGSGVYAAAAIGVVLLYAAGVLGLLLPVGLLSVPAAFVLVQSAAVQAMVGRRRTAAEIWSP